MSRLIAKRQREQELRVLPPDDPVVEDLPNLSLEVLDEKLVGVGSGPIMRQLQIQRVDGVTTWTVTEGNAQGDVAYSEVFDTETDARLAFAALGI